MELRPMPSQDPATSPPRGAAEPLPPRADSMIESMRSVGYDLETAVADIVDNSISAGAADIDIRFEWAGSRSGVRIRDNGHGMSEDELREAMRLGSRSPADERGPEDLGRFGLGLKTASFSQCRRLTVSSRKCHMPPHVRCWDLGVVRAARDWILLDRAQSPTSELALGEPPDTGGTTVLWDALDRIVPDPDAPGAHDFFLERIDQTYQHLAMVFHRYLTGRGAVRVTLNGRPIAPWDPFLTHNDATQVLPETVLGAGPTELLIRPYILPHESKLSQQQHRAASGPKGWNAQQGFYVYRNRRLILSGNWMGMFQQEEHCKLARIQLDIPNTVDQAWQIDVRKAAAAPPPPVRRQLWQIAQRTRQIARRVYGHRGEQRARQLEGVITHVWEERKVGNGYAYRVNRQHPLIKEALDLPKQREALAAAMRLIEECVPVNLITARFSEQSLDQGAPFQQSEDDIVLIMARLARSLCASMTPVQIREMLLKLDPFAHYPDLVAAARFCDEDGL
jgi:hypothetical protein